MTGTVVNLRDYERPVRVPPDEDAEVVPLPVVRVERAIAEMVAKPAKAARRRSLLGDPA